jgi:membrane protein
VEKLVASVTPPATLGTNLVTVNSNLVTPAATNRAAMETNAVAGVVNAPGTGVVNSDAQKEMASQIWRFVQNTRSGTLGATGMVLLIFVAIGLLSRIEETFNDIWGVTRGRSWLHQIQLYSTTIMLGPLLLATALGLAGGAQFQSAKDYIAQTPVIGKFVFDLLPLLVLWLAFTFFYQLVPNTRVKFSAALIGGATAGTLWLLNNLFGFLYVSRVVVNSKIYGSLGLVPVFMIGLYFSWLILLFGAQIAYAFQNRAAYLQDRLADNVNQRGREFVALRLMTCLGQRFQNGRRPATIFQLSTDLGIPSRLTQSVLRVLAHQQLVTEVAGPEAAFVPARPLETINAYDILLALRTGTGQELPLREDPALAEIYGEFARIEQAERAAASTVSLLALTHRIAPPAVLPATTPVQVEKVIAPAALPAESEPVAATTVAMPTEATSPAPGKIAVRPPSAPPEPPRRPVAMPSENDFPL